MPVLENVFSWSKSRDEEFRECKRKYFYSRYASWGGWDRNAPDEARKAYVLKNLKNRWAWKGETVHHVIESVLKSLRSNQPISLDEALGLLTETMRRDYRNSKAKKNWEDPKNNLGLFEMEYGKNISDTVWKEFHDSSAECLKNFYASSLYRELEKDDKKSWLMIEDLEEFDFNGAKIYVKLDFARRRDGNIEIFDWKTGKDDGAAAAVQIGTYALYAMKKWNVPVGQIRAFLFYLSVSNPKPKEQAVDEDLLQSARETITASVAMMKELLADPVKNVPKPKEAFPFTDNVRLCDFCSFYKICEKYIP